MGIAALVVVLALLNLVVVGSVASATDEAHVGLLRLQSIQAFYAAEAGGIVVAKVSTELSSNPAVGSGTGAKLALPAVGSTLHLGNGSTIEFKRLPEVVADGAAEILGSAGGCVRRVEVTLGDE